MKSLAVALLAALFLANALADPAASPQSASPQSAWKATPLTADAHLAEPLVRRGKQVFDARCRACHDAFPGKSRGNDALAMQVPGTYALALRYKGKLPARLEERTDLTPEAVASFVRHGGGGFMPPLRPTEVSDADLKALGAYLARNHVEK